MGRRASNRTDERPSEQGSGQTLFLPRKTSNPDWYIFVRTKKPKVRASKDHCHTDGMIDMTASELMNELISNHADGQRSHVNWRFSDDSKLDVRLLKMKVASKRELASKQASKQVVFPPWITWKSHNSEYANKDNELKASMLTNWRQANEHWTS